MNFLVDTHTFIWILEDNKRLSHSAKATILDLTNRVFVSSVNFWEISLKCSIGKLTLEGFDISTLPALAAKMDMEVLTLAAGDASTFHLLRATHHHDPFDRMLIWQAIRNGYTLITRDPVIKKYESAGLKTLW